MCEKYKVAVIHFPGSNGHNDLYETFGYAGFDPQHLSSKEEKIPEDVFIIGLPGGFSYGDYWRAGVLAGQEPIIKDVVRFIEYRKGLAIGICNGFQILIEAGLLPGALIRNRNLKFVHKWVDLKVVTNHGPWLHCFDVGTKLRMPIAHGEGNYCYSTNLMALKYLENPNGSINDAAGILGWDGRVLGLMPHPERASDIHLGSTDGLEIFKAAKKWLSMI